MEIKQRFNNKNHVLITPFPVQGHINPMLQFSKRLASKGLRVTLVLFTVTDKEFSKGGFGSINVKSVSDDADEGVKTTSFLERFQDLVTRKLPELVAEYETCGHPISCIVYDSMMYWALDLAKQLGLKGASFFTQSCAVGIIYYKVYKGKLNVATETPSLTEERLPPLEIYDLPSFVYDSEYHPGALSIVAGQFQNIEEADWIFFNTFNSLEEQLVNWMASHCALKAIGPTVPSMYLDKRLEDDKEYGISLFQPQIDSCMKWLDSKETCSVVYVSFGSLAALGEKQMEEVASGLKRSGYNFLWVVRESELKKLPNNFANETSEKGLILTWCPQLQVLSHSCIGCFMTHCGWNSTLEALSLGVPMVAIPQWTDQPTNAKFISDVWQVGIKVKVDEDRIVTQEEIETCIREVMEGDKGKEIRRNSEKWKRLAVEAVDDGGSSDRNIEEFVGNLVCNTNIIIEE